VKQFGSDWDAVAKHLPGRTANACKIKCQNYVSTKKQNNITKQQKISLMNETQKKRCTNYNNNNNVGDITQNCVSTEKQNNITKQQNISLMNETQKKRCTNYNNNNNVGNITDFLTPSAQFDKIQSYILLEGISSEDKLHLIRKVFNENSFIGHSIQKKFNKVFYNGVVSFFDGTYYTIHYSDGEKEISNEIEARKILVPK
jgi:hypothetical protein